MQQEIRLDLARRVRELRTEKGLTQEVLAQRAHMAVRHLQKLEGSDLNVTIDTLSRVASALEVDISDLFRRGERQ